MGSETVTDAYLGKWPRLIVVGPPVTRDQAAEIIVRTDSWMLSSNDRPWVRQVAEVAGIELDEYHYASWNAIVPFRRSIGALDLEYMGNDRIMSAYIGGPHGWINWNGAIGASDYNLGKWPRGEEVLADVEKIAAAWPFLRFDMQLIADEGEGAPAINFRVEGGDVEVSKPDGYLASPTEIPDGAILSVMFAPEFTRRERGCTLDQLRAAVAAARGGDQNQL